MYRISFAIIAYSCCSAIHAFLPPTSNAHVLSSSLSSSPFDDLIGGLFGSDKKEPSCGNAIELNNDIGQEDDEMSLSSFRQELTKRQQSKEEVEEVEAALMTTNPQDEEEFSGYDLRDIIYTKYGECFDVQFQRVDSYGVRAVYLVSYYCCSLGQTL